MSTTEDLKETLKYLETPDKSENDKKDYRLVNTNNFIKFLLN